MTFRRDTASALRKKKWLQKHRDELTACGVPHLLLEDIALWFYFLDHGYYTPPGRASPAIDVDHMSLPDAERLCLFLETDDLYPNSSALNRLQYFLKRGPHAET
jgi:hypothetical protein